jgi:hypothetical protein
MVLTVLRSRAIRLARFAPPILARNLARRPRNWLGACTNPCTDGRPLVAHVGVCWRTAGVGRVVRLGRNSRRGRNKDAFGRRVSREGGYWQTSGGKRAKGLEPSTFSLEGDSKLTSFWPELIIFHDFTRCVCFRKQLHSIAIFRVLSRYYRHFFGSDLEFEFNSELVHRVRV